jgi:hypothetical protein
LRDRIGVLSSGITPIIIGSDLLVFTVFSVNRIIPSRVSLYVVLIINVKILLFVIKFFNEHG